MKIRIEKGLPYVTATVSNQGQFIVLDKVILDTGSASTIFSVEQMSRVGLLPEPYDALRRIRGVGGAEFVYTKRVDRLALDDLGVNNFEIEVGAMEYGFDIDGIMGMDFLVQARALINLAQMEVYTESD